MKPDYFDLLSPEPIYFESVGGIKSPTLKEIRAIGYHTYQMYLTVLLLRPESYFDMTGQPEYFNSLSTDIKSKFNSFDLITGNKDMCSITEHALNFFLESDVSYSSTQKGFLLYDKNSPDLLAGIIHKDVWPQLCDIILQRNYIRQSVEQTSEIKSKRALAIMQKLKKGRENHSKKGTSDKNMEIGNIISAVAGKSNSLNLINIWDITIYQLWDSFYFFFNHNILDIQSISVAVWGDKDNHFDAAGWFKSLNNET